VESRENRRMKTSLALMEIVAFEISIFNIIELLREQCGSFQQIVTKVSFAGEKTINSKLRSPQIRYTRFAIVSNRVIIGFDWFRL
jgi:hypothetical protein